MKLETQNIRPLTSIFQPHIEPHFSVTERDPDYDRLVEARWYEHVAEHYLVNSGIDLSLARSEPLVNTPVQLYLAYNRLCRAQLEVSIYSKVLEQEIGQSLQKGMNVLISCLSLWVLTSSRLPAHQATLSS